MQIIHELENGPRGIYTGSIGFLSRQEALFNVAIRTAWVDLVSSSIEMGVGSGILYEADSAREYQECKLKGRFLTEPFEDFQLLETILWEPGQGYQRLNLHLSRLMESAEYFLFPVSRESMEKQLSLQEEALTRLGIVQRVRLLVDREGNRPIQSPPLA